MRKIVAGLHVSADGVVEAPETFTGPYFSPEIGQVIGSLVAAGDTMLLGRVTYQTFAAAFAGQSGGIADALNAIPKVVVSSTLESADWENSTLLKENVAEAITELKKQDGKNINVSGSIDLVRWLLAEGLLDELDLLVFPVVLGRGKRVFAESDKQYTLDLVSSEAFPNGVLHTVYHPA